MSKEKEELCECEKPGATYSGIKGIICCWEDGVPLNIKCCDHCRTFPDDEIAVMFMILWTQRKTLRTALDRIQELSRELKADRDNPWYKQVRDIENIATKALRLDHRIFRKWQSDIPQPPSDHSLTP